ncbi:MAG: thioredoxin family protein [Candidatus Sumerlaeaceae bacterium]|nr:thioredoxin family protein [Candidatus Sumerlaeaceae bacterium]
MMMQTWLRDLVRAVVVSLVIIAAQQGEALPGWSSNFKAALAQAQREGRPMVVDFGSATCPACRMLESRTLTNPQVQGQLNDFVRVYVDGNEQVSLRQSFGVQYYPTLVFLSPEGKVLKRQVGFVGPDEMTSVLRQVATAVPKKAEPSVMAAKSPVPPARNSAKLVAETNLYEAIDASLQQPKTDASKTRNAVVHTVQTDQRSKIELVAEGRGGGEEKLVAQALPVPKNVETPAPLVNIKPENTPEATASPVSAKTSGLPESVKKLQGVSSPESKPAAPTPTPEVKPSPTAVREEQKTTVRSKSAEAAASPESGTGSVSRGKAAESAAKSSKPAPTSTQAQKASARPSVTAADIEGWFADAETKMKAGYKKEARAMYAKIVERDPENKFGKSDLAFIRMVAFTVDRDDDEQRRLAHAKIKEFLKRYPNSPHKDYYTIVRAILATDLGDYAEAHALLDRFPEEFPESRYRELARSLWEELPKDPKSFQRRPVATATSKAGTGKTAVQPTKPASASGAKSGGTQSKPSTSGLKKQPETTKKTSTASNASKSASSKTAPSKSKESKPGASTQGSATSKSKSSEKR